MTVSNYVFPAYCYIVFTKCFYKFNVQFMNGSGYVFVIIRGVRTFDNLHVSVGRYNDYPTNE